jgi:site-specific DNA-methyltransferase (adenine-specific)
MASMDNVRVEDVNVFSHHRQIKPWLLAEVSRSMKEHGYNPAYPIVIDSDGNLVEGRHRLEAARAIGLESVPCIYKPDGVSTIRFGLQCNEDGQLTAADDVFDFAELCWNLAQEKWTGQQIADELGWTNSVDVTRHSQIKNLLHTKAWGLARYELPKNIDVGNGEFESLGNRELPNGKWKESHFRAFLSVLPYHNGDRALMRAQVAAIRELMTGDKLTAKVAGTVATRYAWHTKLAQTMTDNLPKEVGMGARKALLRDVRKNVYGKEHSERDWKRFADTLAALTEQALGVKLFCGDSLAFIPTMEDKSISLLVTDPPYNTTDHDWDQFGTREEFLGWMAEWLGLIQSKMAENYHAFIFCDPDYMADLEILLRSQGWPIKSRIIWEYRNLVKGRDVTDKFIENYQMCFHCGNHALNWSPVWDDKRFMVQQHATPQSNFNEGRNHPTSKPLALLKLFVEVGSKQGDLIFDPFAGGGTTGMASKEIGQRRTILVEKSREFAAAIETRLGIKMEVF